MKESYGEGVATHTGPESCGVVCKGGVEALTGVRAGRVLSRERTFLRDADAASALARIDPGLLTRTDPPQVRVCATCDPFRIARREICRISPLTSARSVVCRESPRGTGSSWWRHLARAKSSDVKSTLCAAGQ